MTSGGPARSAGRGRRMEALLEELYPELRSITGPGLRATLSRLEQELPGMMRYRVPTGTEVFDWRIPREWRLRHAYIEGPDGERIVDVRWHNLHVVNYSIPVDARMSLSELRPHLHTLPDRPDWIPYRTSYYQPSWGFCMEHRRLEGLPEGTYHVVIDSELAEGVLDYGELVLGGDGEHEVLFSAHVCHPSLANDNLSGVVALVELARSVAARTRRRYRYRFLFAPATIGAVAFLATHADAVRRIRHGVVVTGVGGPGVLHYKRTRDGAPLDGIMERVLAGLGAYRILPFTPDGYDERQFNSPGFRLPVGRLSRLPHGEYPEYHTSGDNPTFVSGDAMGGAVAALEGLVGRLEGDGALRSLVPYGEPQLSRHGLSTAEGPVSPAAVRWVLNLADGENTVREMVDRSGLQPGEIDAAVEMLLRKGLVERDATSPTGEGGEAS